MAMDVVAAKKPSIRKTPCWAVWKKRGKASIADAVALSMNIHPAYLKTLRKRNLRKYATYSSRLKSACLALDDTLHRIPDHKVSGDEPKLFIVDLKAFVSFALVRGWGEKYEEFKDLGNLEQRAEPENHAGWVTVRLPYVTQRMQAAFDAMKKHWPTSNPTSNPPQKIIIRTIDELLGNDNRKTDSRTAQELAAMIRPDKNREKDKRATKRRS